MKHDARKLRELRESKGMTQEKLAAVSIVSLRTVQRAEAGEGLHMETLNDLAAALSVPLAELSSEGVGKDSNEYVSLRRVVSSRILVDEITSCEIGVIGCDAEPDDKNMEVLLSLVDFLEPQLPRPWDADWFREHVRGQSLRERIVMTSKASSLLKQADDIGIGVYTNIVWLDAIYPSYNDEGSMSTRMGQPSERVKALQIHITNSLNDRTSGPVVEKWGIDIVSLDEDEWGLS